MAKRSPKTALPYPSRNVEPWFGEIEAFFLQVDQAFFSGRHDRNTVIHGGGLVGWDATTRTFSWSQSIYFFSALSGFQVEVPAGSIVLEHGMFAYVRMVHFPLEDVQGELFAAYLAPNDNLGFALCQNINGELVFRTGLVLPDGGFSGSVLPGGAFAPQTETVLALNQSHVQLATPREEILGTNVFDASRHFSVRTVYLRAAWAPLFSVAGSATLKVYDLGPYLGPLISPVLVFSDIVSTTGFFAVNQAMAVGAAPALLQLAEERRIYRVTVSQTSAPGDTVYVPHVTFQIE